MLWIFVGHVIAMFPDILWNRLVATHEPWMDIFLGHISVHFIPGRNWTWYAIFLISLAFYLYQRAMKEAAQLELCNAVGSSRNGKSGMTYEN